MSNNRYETAVNINASAETIYGHICDLQKHMAWNHSPQKMTVLTEGPARVGSRYKTEEALASTLPLGQRIMFSLMMPIMRMRHKIESYTVAEITELRENEVVGWTAHLPDKNGNKIMQMYWEVALEPNGNGSTKVTQRCHIDPPTDSPLYSMMNDEMVEMNRVETANNLNRLKSLVEA
ncbi:MAG: SRPBCC family protein [Ardenticatenaceae bacterium]|nr:SRPBCC family protein [Ardenticatenaceae bacterium]MCB8975239.1 SRPBCC family protein [Ardenticatenaceae bacterium]